MTARARTRLYNDVIADSRKASESAERASSGSNIPISFRTALFFSEAKACAASGVVERIGSPRRLASSGHSFEYLHC